MVGQTIICGGDIWEGENMSTKCLAVLGNKTKQNKTDKAAWIEQKLTENVCAVARALTVIYSCVCEITQGAPPDPLPSSASHTSYQLH